MDPLDGFGKAVAPAHSPGPLDFGARDFGGSGSVERQPDAASDDQIPPARRPGGFATMAGSAARFAAGVACAGAGIVALMASFGPPPGPDPVKRFELAAVLPPPVDASPAEYQPIRDQRLKVRPFGLIGRFVPNYETLLATPTGSIAGGLVVPDGGGRPAFGPPASLPGPTPDGLVGHEAGPAAIPAAESAHPAAPPEPPVDVATAPVAGTAGETVAARNYDPAPAGPMHFLQGGYFADQANAASFADSLAAAGLPVRVEETANGAGAPRWLVLIGPYFKAEDLGAARDAARDLLAGAFPIQRGNAGRP